MEDAEPRWPRSPRETLVAILLLSAVFTSLNAFKPLHIDDPFMYRVAEQIVEDPADPYGFDIFWAQWPQPVYEELTPPVVPYWWSVGLALFGDRPALWKLWFFPFALLLCGSLWLLLRRLAPGLEWPLTLATVLSPAILPSLNLMQDLPAYGLGLAAMASYLAAYDRSSDAGSVGAGLLAGLALQTKYTLATFLAAMLVHALLQRRWRPALISVAVAVGLFAGWEAWMTSLYGQGMFVGQLKSSAFWVPRAAMIPELLRLLGGTLGVLGLAGLAALGVPARAQAALAAALLLGYGMLWIAPWGGLLYTLLGVMVAVSLAGCMARLLASRSGASGLDRFLILWLLGEIAGFFFMAPFPAVRRVLGLMLVATLLVGRTCAGGDLLRRVPWTLLVGCSIGLGLLHQVVDTAEARSQQDSVAIAARQIRSEDPAARIWYVGHWGFQFYAERAGMLPIVPDQSRLEAGDWVVSPDRVDHQEIVFDAALQLRNRVTVPAGLPLQTGQGFYGGSLPLEHLDGPRLSTGIYRVLRPFVPVSDWPTLRVTDWLLRMGDRTSRAALPALGRRLVDGTTEDRRLAASVLARVGDRASTLVPGLIEALSDADATVRYWSAVALGQAGPLARKALPELERLEHDPSREVRDAAVRSLESLAAEPAGPAPL